MKNWLTKCFATGLFTGYSPTVPGTVGTLPAWLIAWFIIGDNQSLLIAGTVVMTMASVWLATLAEPLFGHDAKKIVIDEWAGMFVSLLLIPYQWEYYLLAFAAFRVFDVLKIPPAAQAERLPRGWGVTADDIVAGIQANLVTQAAIWYFWSSN